ncbi:MAG: UDP-3-O-(3-hydroxymyristoyl)glucosamine N-acyltransferase [Gemmataceae bacterium]|nr:UDP-3-O-(3-hydroxymyristoyl)glucosamine N-acyltransferase [Gemmataceae bacterium]
MSVTARQLAEWVQGSIEGNGDLMITAARPLPEAGPGDISFLENDKEAAKLLSSRAGALVVRPGVAVGDKCAIRVGDPLAAFVTIFQKLHGRPPLAPTGIDPRAVIAPDVVIGTEPSIAAFVSIGAGTRIGARCRIETGAVIGRDCRLGDDVTIHPNAVLYDGSVIGDRTTIHANAVLGADGFGYRFHQGRHVKVPQLGHVDIGADVEIGACTTIDRGTFGPTRIGTGTKIDNQVMVGHNCQIGNHVILVSQVGVAGSCVIGDYAVLAGQVGVADHLTIGAGAVVAAQAGLMRDVPAGTKVIGAPARPEREQFRLFAAMERLPDLVRDVQRIKKQLGIDQEGKRLAG